MSRLVAAFVFALAQLCSVNSVITRSIVAKPGEFARVCLDGKRVLYDPVNITDTAHYLRELQLAINANNEHSIFTLTTPINKKALANANLRLISNAASMQLIRSMPCTVNFNTIRHLFVLPLLPAHAILTFSGLTVESRHDFVSYLAENSVPISNSIQGLPTAYFFDISCAIVLLYTHNYYEAACLILLKAVNYNFIDERIKILAKAIKMGLPITFAIESGLLDKIEPNYALLVLIRSLVSAILDNQPVDVILAKLITIATKKYVAKAGDYFKDLKRLQGDATAIELAQIGRPYYGVLLAALTSDNLQRFFWSLYFDLEQKVKLDIIFEAATQHGGILEGKWLNNEFIVKLYKNPDNVILRKHIPKKSKT